MGDVIRSAAASPNLEAEIYTTTVTLSTGTATLTYTDIDGIDAGLGVEPLVFVTGPTGSEAVTSKGTSQCTINGSASDDVECLVVVPRE